MLGIEAPSEEEVNELLDLAGIAARASERTAAPVSCWLVARAGVTPAEARAKASGSRRRLLSEGPAGLLLTGGASTRMGRDKATLPLGPAGMTLGRHLGSMLEAVTVVALEVGPHASLLDQPTERDPGEGPLAAIALGTRTLRHLGFEGPVLVLATDLPCLSPELL